jgi:hypothetical protein
MKLKPILTLGSVVVFAAGTLLPAQAAPPAKGHDKAPLDQAVESVEKNRQKNPDNPGLENAAERLQTNTQRIEERRAAEPPVTSDHGGKAPGAQKKAAGARH